MKIDKMDVYYVALPLIYPWRTAYGEDAAIHSVLVRMVSGDQEGWGETTPFYAPTYSPETASSAFFLIKEIFGPFVVGQRVGQRRRPPRRPFHLQGQPLCQGGGRNRLVGPGSEDEKSASSSPPRAANGPSSKPDRISASRIPSTCSSGTSKRRSGRGSNGSS